MVHRSNGSTARSDRHRRKSAICRPSYLGELKLSASERRRRSDCRLGPTSPQSPTASNHTTHNFSSLDMMTSTESSSDATTVPKDLGTSLNALSPSSPLIKIERSSSPDYQVSSPNHQQQQQQQQQLQPQQHHLNHQQSCGSARSTLQLVSEGLKSPLRVRSPPKYKALATPKNDRRRHQPSSPAAASAASSSPKTGGSSSSNAAAADSSSDPHGAEDDDDDALQTDQVEVKIIDPTTVNVSGASARAETSLIMNPSADKCRKRGGSGGSGGTGGSSGGASGSGGGIGGGGSRQNLL